MRLSEALEAPRLYDPARRVVMLTVSDAPDDLMQAIRAGAVPAEQAEALLAAGLEAMPRTLRRKVLLAYLNGLRHMKAFSILQGLRYLIPFGTVEDVINA